MNLHNYRVPIYTISLTRNGSLIAEDRPQWLTSQRVYAMVKEYFHHHDREEMLVVMLNSKLRFIGVNSVSVGTLDLSIVHPREVFKPAILSNSAAIILVHNHPSGETAPSQEDRTLTTRMVEAGKLLGIKVIDHLVIGEERYKSFADEGWL